MSEKSRVSAKRMSLLPSSRQSTRPYILHERVSERREGVPRVHRIIRNAFDIKIAPEDNGVSRRLPVAHEISISVDALRGTLQREFSKFLRGTRSPTCRYIYALSETQLI